MNVINTYVEEPKFVFQKISNVLNHVLVIVYIGVNNEGQGRMPSPGLKTITSIQ